ncbi:adenylyl-sulfate kinase [Paenibacillus harenae]|uniref:Adenylyl-sulfate kinase n=2 Tax=Paenibacillus harenae TaxID=306543 RepID=A0ABT9TY60_PAEHA|nr:adenylyl-sulfate kinase [Paenibacillus harenae]
MNLIIITAFVRTLGQSMPYLSILTHEEPWVNDVHTRLFSIFIYLFLGGCVIHRYFLEKMNGHKSGVVWFTGLPGSGKTTLAIEVEKRLLQEGIRCTIIDGDRLRKRLNHDLGFTETDRMENLRRAAVISLMFIEAGVLVLAPLISPFDSSRAIIKQHFNSEDFTELYVKCSLEVCERRDPKGMYRLAREGTLLNFTGVSAPYEAPSQPDIVVDTENFSLEYCVDFLTDYVLSNYKIETQKENDL